MTTLHEERYVLAIAEGHKAVRLRDQKTGEIHEFKGPRALYDALGVLANWRERDLGREWRWESDGNGGWVSAPRCHEPTCPDFGSWDFGEGTCPAEHADPAGAETKEP